MMMMMRMMRMMVMMRMGKDVEEDDYQGLSLSVASSVCALQELSFVSSTSEARLFFLPRTDHHVPGDRDGDHDGDHEGDDDVKQAGLKPGQ